MVNPSDHPADRSGAIACKALSAWASAGGFARAHLGDDGALALVVLLAVVGDADGLDAVPVDLAVALGRGLLGGLRSQIRQQSVDKVMSRSYAGVPGCC
jgi:hypothetical protein